MSEVNVKICSKRRRSASLNVQRRRQRLIALWNTVRRFTVRKAALCLGVSRRTVERDLCFLKNLICWVREEAGLCLTWLLSLELSLWRVSTRLIAVGNGNKVKTS
jgi:hypothetical protein